jgi:hypothetical protein
MRRSCSLVGRFLAPSEGTLLAERGAVQPKKFQIGASMNTKLLSLLILGVLLITQFPNAIAQGLTPQGSLHDWSAVQGMAVDERLIVKQKDGKTIEGRMIEATENNLTLTVDKKVMNIARDSIRQIEHSTGKAQKGKWTAIGAGIGTAAGAGIGAFKYSPSRDDSEIWIGVGAIFGAGAGALTGLIIGADKRRRELIYTAL